MEVMSYKLHPDMPLNFRPTQTEDEPFLFELYAATRRQEMALVDWDQAQMESFLQNQFRAQLSHYRIHYPRAEHDLILLEGKQIGRIYIERRDDEIRLIDLSLMPGQRNSGLGTTIVKALQAEAFQRRQPIRLSVWEINESALRWQLRLGFKIIEKVGIHFFMEWLPNST